jgi:hypothetical protein
MTRDERRLYKNWSRKRETNGTFTESWSPSGNVRYWQGCVDLIECCKLGWYHKILPCKLRTLWWFLVKNQELVLAKTDSYLAQDSVIHICNLCLSHRVPFRKTGIRYKKSANNYVAWYGGLYKGFLTFFSTTVCQFPNTSKFRNARDCPSTRWREMNHGQRLVGEIPAQSYIYVISVTKSEMVA